jgi:hypothetical protein
MTGLRIVRDKKTEPRPAGSVTPKADLARGNRLPHGRGSVFVQNWGMSILSPDFYA